MLCVHDDTHAQALITCSQQSASWHTCLPMTFWLPTSMFRQSRIARQCSTMLKHSSHNTSAPLVACTQYLSCSALSVCCTDQGTSAPHRSEHDCALHRPSRIGSCRSNCSLWVGVVLTLFYTRVHGVRVGIPILVSEWASPCTCREEGACRSEPVCRPQQRKCEHLRHGRGCTGRCRESSPRSLVHVPLLPLMYHLPQPHCWSYEKTPVVLASHCASWQWHVIHRRT